MTTGSATLLLTRSDVVSLLDYDTCISAVEEAFLASATGRVLTPAICGTHVTNGGFHVKTAGLIGDTTVYALKVNANFPGNRERTGLPTIQGLITLHDAVDGRVLAVMDSIRITEMRTAAATAVAAKYLAREDSRTATIIGCGVQGRSQLRALTRVRDIEKVFAFDHNTKTAEHYRDEMSAELGIGVDLPEDYRAASRLSDIIITCTPAARPVLGKGDVSAGCFVGAVGADSDTKHEIEPALLAASTVVADILEQSATMGDVRHAIASGAMTRDDVYAELADIVSGAKPGRTSADQIIVFDSTGTALEDVAAAAIVYERAMESGIGDRIDFGG